MAPLRTRDQTKGKRAREVAKGAGTCEATGIKDIAWALAANAGCVNL